MDVVSVNANEDEEVALVDVTCEAVYITFDLLLLFRPSLGNIPCLIVRVDCFLMYIGDFRPALYTGCDLRVETSHFDR